MERDEGLGERTKTNGSLDTGNPNSDKIPNKLDGKLNGHVKTKANGTSTNEDSNAHHGQTSSSPKPIDGEPVAIVGMACRLPGDAVNVKGLWDMCCEGRSAWSEILESRINGKNFFHPDFSKRGTVGPAPRPTDSLSFVLTMIVQHARCAFHETRYHHVRRSVLQYQPSRGEGSSIFSKVLIIRSDC